MRQILSPPGIDHKILCFSVDIRGGICYAQGIGSNHFSGGSIMTKQELINQIAKNNPWGLTKKATEEVIDAVFNNIRKAVSKEQRFAYPEFGIWTVRTRKARNGRNPRTGATIRIKASKTVSFRPAKSFKTKL
jgi:nucleoid DNA-binding protein